MPEGQLQPRHLIIIKTLQDKGDDTTVYLQRTNATALWLRGPLAPGILSDLGHVTELIDWGYIIPRAADAEAQELHLDLTDKGRAVEIGQVEGAWTEDMSLVVDDSGCQACVANDWLLRHGLTPPARSHLHAHYGGNMFAALGPWWTNIKKENPA